MVPRFILLAFDVQPIESVLVFFLRFQVKGYQGCCYVGESEAVFTPLGARVVVSVLFTRDRLENNARQYDKEDVSL